MDNYINIDDQNSMLRAYKRKVDQSLLDLSRWSAEYHYQNAMSRLIEECLESPAPDEHLQAVLDGSFYCERHQRDNRCRAAKALLLKIEKREKQSWFKRLFTQGKP